ncbi:MAG: sugar phosphate isomerase/epimerase family protein [Planctomycetota bacterium]|jgi:sugar phosphate isomerase/epimerase
MSVSGQRITRRTALCHCAQAASFAAVASNLRPLLAAPKSRWFKIAACDWSLGKGADLAAFDVAKEIGLDGVQVSLGSTEDDMHLHKPKMQKAYLRKAKQTGVEMASLALGELNRVPLKSDPRAAKWLAASVDVCAALGMTVIMPAFFGKGALDMDNATEIGHVVKILKEIAPAAEKRKVIIGLENTLSAEDNIKIVDRVGSPAVQVYYDTGNSYYKDRDIYKEIRTLGKLMCELHVKDGRNVLGQGPIDFKKVRKAVDEIGYSGWIVLESARPGGVIPSYTAQCKFLKGIFPRRV